MISSWDILLCRVLLLFGQMNSSLSRNILCRYYRSGPKLNVFDLVGNWVTVYTQPKAVKCFMLKIKALTDTTITADPYCQQLQTTKSYALNNRNWSIALARCCLRTMRDQILHDRRSQIKGAEIRNSPTSTTILEPHYDDTFQTALEQQELRLRYGNFTGLVDWSSCYLEVESSFGKHFFQGDGREAGVLENVIIFKSVDGQYMLQEQSADQWTIYGEAGRKLVVMRDCAGKASAVFARVPYWPTPHQLYAILYRSGVKPQTLDRIPCEANEINNQ